jgi:hypothetical protein
VFLLRIGARDLIYKFCVRPLGDDAMHRDLPELRRGLIS